MQIVGFPMWRLMFLHQLERPLPSSWKCIADQLWYIVITPALSTYTDSTLYPEQTQGIYFLPMQLLYKGLILVFPLMLRLHRTTFSPRPYHVLKFQERGEDGAKMKQFRISKFPLRPYYVPATSLLRPHHVLTTSFTFPLRPQYALTKFIPFPLRPCYVLTKTKRFIPRANYVSSTF